MKNVKKMTYEESKQTIMPYKSLPTNNTKCKEHLMERREDAIGHRWLQCKFCGISK